MPQQDLRIDSQKNVWDYSSGKPVFVRSEGQPSFQTTVANPYAQSSIQSQSVVDAGKAAMTPEQVAQSKIETKQKTLDYNNAVMDSQTLGDMTKTGPAFLATLPPKYRNLVDLVGTNQMLVGSMGLRNAQMRQITTAAKQGYPKYDPSLAPVRQNAIYDYSGGGKQALAIQAMDRAASTMQQMKALSDKMGGSQTGYAPLNTHVAGTQQDLGKDRIVATSGFKALMPDLMGQLSTVLGANGASAVSDRKEVKDGFTAEASQDQRNEAFRVIANAVIKAGGEFRQGWNSAANPGGGNIPPPSWVSHESADFLEKMAGVKPGTLGADIPHDMNSQNQYAASGILPTPIVPPGGGAGGSGGNGGNGGIPMVPATGGTVNTPYSADTNAGLASRLRSGTSAADAQTYLDSTSDGKGHVINPVNWAKTQKWLSDYKKDNNGNDYQGPLNSYRTDPTTPVQDMSQTLGLNGTKGGTFLANYANAAGAGIPEWLAGKQSQNNLNQMNSDHPWMAGAGSAAGFLPAAFAGGAGIKGVGSLLARDGGAIGTLGTELSTNRVLPGLLGSMGVGASIGASQSPGNRLQGAAQGAFLSAAGDAAGGAIVSPLLKGVAGTEVGQGIANSGVGQRVRGMFGGDPTQTFAPPPAMLPGEAKIAAAAKPDINTITDKLTNAQTVPNLPYALGDTTQPLRSLLGSATRFNPEVASAVDKTLADRQLNASTRALISINDNLAPTSSINSIAADVKARAQKAADPFYQAAYADDPVFSQKLDDILSKPAAQSAFKDATDMAANEGHPATVTNPDGTTAYPLRTLHYTQQALDDMLQSPKFQNADGTMNNKGRILSNLRGDLATETQGLNGNFKQAQNTYSNIAGQGDAAQFGHGLIKGSPTNPIDAASGLGDIPSQNLPYVGQGYASGMADKIGVLGDNANPFSAVNGKDWQRQNLRQVFPDGADQFGVHQGLENDMHQTNYDVFGNSKTQGRAAADAAFAPSESGIGGLVTDAALMHGGVVPVNTLMKYGKKIGGGIWDKVSGSASAPDMAAQVAPLLMHTDPQQSLADINRMLQQKAVMDAYKAQFRPYGGMFGASASPAIGQQFLGGGAQQN